MQCYSTETVITYCNLWFRTTTTINKSCLELIMLVDKFPCRYKTVFIVILIFEDILYHHFMMCVIR